MNAYELADELQELDSKLHLINIFKSATMLRQQADRIAELEKDLHMVERHYDQLDKDVSSKPVAWMDKETGCFVYSEYDYEDLDEHGKDGLIPLYIHPAKELFDEEIMAISAKFEHRLVDTEEQWSSCILDFARAIIKEITE